MKTLTDTILEKPIKEQILAEFDKKFLQSIKTDNIKEVFFKPDSFRDFLGKALERQKEELVKRLPVLKEHICRFNDGECECDCYKGCLKEIIKIIEEL